MPNLPMVKSLKLSKDLLRHIERDFSDPFAIGNKEATMHLNKYHRKVIDIINTMNIEKEIEDKTQ